MLNDEDRRWEVGGELGEHGTHSLETAGRGPDDDDVVSVHAVLR
jgi:hypothetical protein